jgi:hypothetical protein
MYNMYNCTRGTLHTQLTQNAPVCTGRYAKGSTGNVEKLPLRFNARGTERKVRGGVREFYLENILEGVADERWCVVCLLVCVSADQLPPPPPFLWANPSPKTTN